MSDGYKGNKNTGYFAARSGKDTASVLLDKSHYWTQAIESSGYLEKLKAMWRSYHGAYYTSAGNGHQITFSGEQGELVQLPVNHLRNLASHDG